MFMLALTDRSSLARAGRVLGTAAAALLLAGLGACGTKHYTAEHKNAAKVRMEQMKSATEWQMAHQAFLAGDLAKALRHVNYSIELNENVVKSHVLRGRIHMEMGQLEQASASFAAGEALDGKNVDVWYFQGILAERIDRKEEALRRYRGAGELDGTNAQYAVAAAEMMIALDRTEEAEAYLQERGSGFDHSAGVKQTLGHIAMLRDEPAKAATLFNEARLLAPDDSAIIEDLVRAYITTANYADAEMHLARLLAKADGQGRRDLQHLRAKCLLQLERPVEARDLLVKLTSDSAGTADTESWIELGQVSYLLSDFAKVRTAASRLIVTAPDRAEGYVLRGLFLRSTKDLAGAEQNFRKAISIKNEPDTCILLGMTYRDLNRHAEARACFQEALRLNPGDATATKLLASAATR